MAMMRVEEQSPHREPAPPHGHGQRVVSRRTARRDAVQRLHEAARRVDGPRGTGDYSIWFFRPMAAVRRRRSTALVSSGMRGVKKGLFRLSCG